jgi:hypothetical protein
MRRRLRLRLSVSLKGHSHEKVCEIIPFNRRLGPNKGMITILNSPSHCYDLSNEGSNDVKLAYLICKNLQCTVSNFRFLQRPAATIIVPN